MKKVINVLRRMYDEYALKARLNHESESHPPKEKEDIGRNSVAIPTDISLSDVDPTFMKFLATASSVQKVDKLSEIDEYLQEGLVGFNDPEFDLLAWWKGNASKYKVLHLIARDLLAAPVSTVSSESVFSTGGRILDVFRSSLSSDMAEAIICSQNWLRAGSAVMKDLDVDNIEETTHIGNF